MEIKKVYEDKRGYIQVIENFPKEGEEYVVLEIKKGAARGGCYHLKDEYYAVISGKLEYMEGPIGGPYNKSLLATGNGGTNKANFSHAFIALEDSIIAEWGLTLPEKTLDIKDSKLLRIVNKMNKKL
ncbi:MAG: hypothetical protein Q8Q04_01710 [archaeon]|nr:hypothetical protein [archaeon]